MKLLLDTHVWLRAIRRPESLSREVRRQLERFTNELLLSPISIWEAGLLARDRKIVTKPTFKEWLAKALTLIPIQEAPLNFAVAEEATRIQLPQNDLADVILAATASVFDLTLVTEDRQLLACRWLKTMAND